MTLLLAPLTQREASAFIREHHRHHEPARGDVFRLSAVDGDQIVGVAVVGRPVSRRPTFALDSWPPSARLLAPTPPTASAPGLVLVLPPRGRLTWLL